MLTMQCKKRGGAGALRFERNGTAIVCKSWSATTARGSLIRSIFLTRFTRRNSRARVPGSDSAFAMELYGHTAARFSAGTTRRVAEARLWCEFRWPPNSRQWPRKRRDDDFGSAGWPDCANPLD